MPAELTIVVPTYNEVDNVELLIKALESSLSGLDWEAIFVDDDSDDGTAAHVRKIAQEKAHVRCIHRIKRKGLSSACIEGVLSSSSPHIVVMDADMQHDEGIISAMLNKLKSEDLDIVIGSRYMEGGSTGLLSSNRVWISRIAIYISRLVLKFTITDPMSGFFILKRSFFESVMRKLSGRGFKILLDILVSSDKGLRYAEMPYVMRARTKGESKLSLDVIWDFVILVLNKLSGQLLPARFLSFAMVGFSGIFVHLFVLGVTNQIMHINFVLAQGVATIVAMTSNYILNNLFTFRENKLSGKRYIRGLISFYLACSIGAIINVAVAGLLFESSFPWWLAGALGAVAGAVWNYAVTSMVTWGHVKTQ